ncbi:cobalamin-dependent protein [Desulfosoma caldarium]|uniref:Methylmalonyl-CoA mutase cobalamin-binding subunit n=1 Tax=Desulfosoma caldarium TaxID=610254 RepID=A0A3N1VF60_9BACT|nr:cobalamin-dependent protein [Desulfosoma caldarium]ROR01454.1 methylmalonyl-CoA mutase cobalamin-binding subunit [Desulfosoma caldarium]
MSTPSEPSVMSWEEFKARVRDRVHHWRVFGLPGRWQVLQELKELQRLQEALGAETRPPLNRFPMIYLATLDDGWGHGLDVIDAAARAVGAPTVRLGLLCSTERIVDACRRNPPHVLGLTILHADTESAVSAVVQGLPSGVTVVAGGPVFRWDPDFAQRTGLDAVIQDVGDFLQWISARLP